MKVVFSRKGFDSSAGGCPSPIVDGRPVSLPIPTRMPSPTRYRDLNGIAELVLDLTRGRLGPDSACHLDPDLDADTLPRTEGWRGALGQVGAAQGHLANNGIGAGDLFLFWGLFRLAAKTDRWEFFGEREHRIFGWLQIEDVLSVGDRPNEALAKHPWLADHPHAREGWTRSNTIYVASERLALAGSPTRLPGWGLFKSGLRLTATASKNPSVWSVPDWLNPMKGGSGMTFHPVPRWTESGSLQSAARGQEFVADIAGRTDALDWLTNLFDEHA